MILRDPIHGNIEFGGIAEKLINTPEMQRLRRIKQLGFTYLVYPGANHTRFEHSIGSMHVTKDILGNIENVYGEELPIIGLLHDIGHGPFSHQSEDVIKRYTHKSHEQWGEYVIKNSDIEGMIRDSDISFNKIISYFRGEGQSEIVGGTLGSDRIDYIMRDAYYTGVAYGIIDYNRLRSKLTMYRGKPAIYEQGLSAAELMLMARYFMYVNVYGHHTQRIAQGMFQNALIGGIENGDLDANEAALMVDEQVLNALAESEPAAKTVQRIRARDLYKRAYYEDVGLDVKEREIEDALGRAGFVKSDCVVSIKGFGIGKGDIVVLDKDGSRLAMLSELSPLMETLDSLIKGKRRLLVACDKKNVVKARSAVLKLLG